MKKTNDWCCAKCLPRMSFVVAVAGTGAARSEECGDDDGDARVGDCANAGSQFDAVAVTALAAACFPLE